MKDFYVYPAIFTFEHNGVSVEFPDLPGCLPCGADEEEALANAKEALALQIYGMEEDNESLPEASRIAELNLNKYQAAVLVEAWMPAFRSKMANKSVNKMLTLPKWLSDLGERRNINFSQLLQSALKEHLGIFDYSQARKQH